MELWAKEGGIKMTKNSKKKYEVTISYLGNNRMVTESQLTKKQADRFVEKMKKSGHGGNPRIRKVK